MSRRILLAWELGAGRGHILILGWIAAALRRCGFEPVFAVQRPAALRDLGADGEGVECHQAPLWPGFFNNETAIPGRATTLGDSIGDLGLRSADAAAAMIRAWDVLLEQVRPDAVVADFAPACLLACRGRVPTIAVGDGYTLPPATLDRYPQFTGEGSAPRKYDEAVLMANVNLALQATGRPAVAHLPEIFSADRHCAGTFDELDPYAGMRTTAVVAPWLPVWDQSAPADRREVFCYFGVPSAVEATIVAGLAHAAANGVRIRANFPVLGEETARALAAAGVSVERSPVPFELIHRQARLIVSYASFGLVSSALAAGIPQLVIPPALAKRLTARAVERLGVGRSIELAPGNPLEGALLGQAIAEMREDRRFAEKAAACAPDFARRLDPRPAEIVADLVPELV
jgi:hypothetical protein